MSQFYKLRALSLVFWFVFLTTKVYAQSPEPKDKFLQSLEGIESQIYALPQSSLAQIESLEEDSLLQNQPKDLLIRYWLAKSTVLELLGRDKESLAVVDKGLSLTPEQSQEHLLFKLIQIRAMMAIEISIPRSRRWMLCLKHHEKKVTRNWNRKFCCSKVVTTMSKGTIRNRTRR